MSSLANSCRIGLALLSHVRARAVMVGDLRAITIAEADEKLFMFRHALYGAGVSYRNTGKYH